MQKPTFKEALKFWLKLGLISFGGPAGQIAIMHEYLVEKKKWISETKFMHALNYCMILPGPEAQQLATYTGWMLHGTRGGLAAGTLFVLPSMFILLGLSMVYVGFGHVPLVYALFNGLKPAIIAIVIVALVKIGKRSLVSRFHYAVAAIAFVCIFFLNIPFPIIIIGCIVLALLIQKLAPSLLHSTAQNGKQSNDDEAQYFINKNTVIDNIGFKPLRFYKQLFTGILLWLIPFVALYFLTAQFGFWQLLITFFTKAALVTFGGAYAVLPYVAQVSVEKYHWLSNLQMIDGLALGETTPGPLIMVLAFVGFMAGYHHYNNALLFGAAGLAVTTFYTFLPCFLFIFIGAPVIERTQQNKQLKQVLTIVTAAVVGVVLNLTIYLGKAVIFPNTLSFDKLDYLALAWVIISFFALQRLKVNMMLWIAVSAVFGIIRYLLLAQ